MVGGRGEWSRSIVGARVVGCGGVDPCGRPSSHPLILTGTPPYDLFGKKPLRMIYSLIYCRVIS